MQLPKVWPSSRLHLTSCQREGGASIGGQGMLPSIESRVFAVENPKPMKDPKNL